MPADSGLSAVRPLSHPARGIAIISERESLGDGFYKLHLLRALKRAYPAEPIDWYVSEGHSPYAGPMARIVAPYVAKVVPFAGFRRPRLRALRRLRALPDYSLVIDNRTNNAVVMATRLLLRAHLYQAPTPGYLFCSRRPSGIRPRHKLERLMKLLEAVTGCPVDTRGEIDLPAAALEMAARLLPGGPRYVGLVPGASGPERRWPLERFVELARWIAARGGCVVFVLGPVERELAPILRQAVPEALFPSADESGTLADVDLSLAVARRLAAAVSNDTGTGHLLGAAGTPLLSLFGPTDPRVWHPVAARAEIVWARDHGGREMTRIPMTSVTAALGRLMG